jgi:hypothetical protein
MQEFVGIRKERSEFRDPVEYRPQLAPWQPD